MELSGIQTSPPRKSVAGALVRQAQLLLGASHRGKAPAPIRWLAGLFRSNDKGETGIDALAHTLQKAAMVVTPLTTGITAIYAVVKSIGVAH